MKIGIISYLPDEEQLRNTRKLLHQKQLNFFKEHLANVELIVCAQNYKEEDYDSRVDTYIKFGAPIGFSKARNELLKYFYSTSDDFMCFADDDSYFYPYYDAPSLIKDIEEKPSLFYKLDYINALSPAITPFKNLNYSSKNMVMHNYKFISCQVKNCNFCIMKNYKKFYNDEIFFDETKTGYNGLEDVSFIALLIKKGFVTSTCSNLILKAPREHSVWNKDPESRKQAIKHNAELMGKEFGIKLKANGALNWKEFQRKYKEISFPIYVPRSVLFKFPDNLVPKGVEVSRIVKKRLF